ncbi:ABC transporter permease [Pseudonocardia nigra]|uniref:ABC transporter permease n=1 Tax=Pseudonocardia nigra TaxID=1921578 RepID=UPI001C5D6FCB|nr:ABC transporter permease [Pseudonocardia nigra]
MTTMTVPPGADQLRWVLSDSWTIARRDLLHWVRNPSVIISSVAFPVMFVLLFGYVFGSAIAVPGGGDYREFLMPGMFAQAMVNGAAATVAVVAADRARGVTDRFRSMPVARSAPVIGRSIADMFGSVVDLLVLVGCGLLVGWTTRTGLLPTLAAIGLLLLLRFAMIWVGIFLGLVVSQEAAGLAWAPLFPLTMVANTFVAPSQMPGWLGTIADWNPISATVTATRELFGNPGAGLAATSWPAENAMLLAVLWPVLIVAVFLPLAVRRYRAISR